MPDVMDSFVYMYAGVHVSHDSYAKNVRRTFHVIVMQLMLSKLERGGGYVIAFQVSLK